MRRFVAVLAALTLTLTHAAPPPASAATTAAESPAYRPPVEAPLADTFRPPATDYGSGNRGIDYATAEGQPVAAAADGEVTFAGRVGNELHVVVLHADGLRTSYSFLASADVRRGDKVEQGQRVGTASASGLHFGARAGEKYLDPLTLFTKDIADPDGRRRAYLVDDDTSKPLDEVVERRGLMDSLRGVRRGVGRALAATENRLRATFPALSVVIDSVTDLAIPLPVYLVTSIAQWERDQATCTPAETPVPTAADIGSDRIAILVGGLGSRTGKASILEVDTAALGYEPGDVHQFSYRSDGRPYDADDTQRRDLDALGAQLARQIADLQRRRPGVRVDVIAHSQGGLVARSAVTRHGARPTTLITLATPHEGTEWATMASAVDSTNLGNAELDVVGSQRPFGIDPNATTVLQMAEGSAFLADLKRNGRWPPRDTTHAVSIGANGDLAVPSRHAFLPGAFNTVVSPYGTPALDNHGKLPGSPEGMREIARALVGQGPTCRSLQQTLADDLASMAISSVLDAATVVAATIAVYADVSVGQVEDRPGASLR